MHSLESVLERSEAHFRCPDLVESEVFPRREKTTVRPGRLRTPLRLGHAQANQIQSGRSHGFALQRDVRSRRQKVLLSERGESRRNRYCDTKEKILHRQESHWERPLR